jgi:hypothetical protein
LEHEAPPKDRRLRRRRTIRRLRQKAAEQIAEALLHLGHAEKLLDDVGDDRQQFFALQLAVGQRRRQPLGRVDADVAELPPSLSLLFCRLTCRL